MSKLKYVAIDRDENWTATDFHESESEAIKELEANTQQTWDELEPYYYIQGFTEEEIENLPEID